MKKRRPSYEIVIVVAAVLLAVVVAAALTASRAELEKRSLMTRELSAMRGAIAAYRLIHKVNPESLGALAAARHRAGGEEMPFIDRLPGGGEGVAIDPFGHPYAYDPNSGWVASTAPGYERW